MTVLIKRDELKKKYPCFQIFPFKNYPCLSLDGDVLSTETLNCICRHPYTVSEGGCNTYDLKIFCELNDIPFPTGITSPDYETGALIWRTFYLEYKDLLRSFVNDYLILHKEKDISFLDELNYKLIDND